MLSLRRVPSLLFAILVLAAQSSEPAETAIASRTIQAAAAAPTRFPVVYVSDFDLDILRTKEKKSPPPGNPPGTPTDTMPPAPSTEAQKQEGLIQEANKLVDSMSGNLVKALELAGYKVHRLRAGETHPGVGMLIRGVFAEPDEQNRVRRLLVGGEAVTPKMLLFVGVNNLAQPEQALYELANPPSNDSRYGPVITVTSYSPVSRFELDRKPAEDDLKKIATQIAEDLTALLKANPTVVPH